MTVKLTITEYRSTGFQGVPGVVAPIAAEPAVLDQVVTATATTPIQATPFNAATNFIRMQADAACHVQFGSNPTATASMQPLSPGVEYWRAVTPGQTVSVYDGTST